MGEGINGGGSGSGGSIVASCILNELVEWGVLIFDGDSVADGV